MFRPRTRVVREGYLWYVERFSCGAWERYYFPFQTRRRARAHQHWWSVA